MNLLNLFKKSEWSKLKEHRKDVQQDIAYLIAFDSLIKSAVNNRSQRLIDEIMSGNNAAFKKIIQNLNNKEVIQELEIAFLSTGVGRKFDGIRGSKVPNHSVVKMVGILVMCQFRNKEQITVENDITKSGYSFASHEAKAQFIILLANLSSIQDLQVFKDFDNEYFSDFWMDTRAFIFDQLQLNICAEVTGMTQVVKERFDQLSENRKKTLLILANSLEKTKSNDEQNVNVSKSVIEQGRSTVKFNTEQHKLDHPLLYIPYTKVNQLILDCFKLVIDQFKSIGINAYDFRRLSGVKNDIPDLEINMILFFDANVLAYCIVVAVAQSKEDEFVRSGVWNKITKQFESDNILEFALMSGFKKNGMLNPAVINPSMPSDSSNSGLDLLSLIRKSPNEFLKSNETISKRVKILVQGTVVFGNILSHPVYSKPLSIIIDSLFEKVTNSLDEFSKGELLSWDQQKDLR